MPPEEALSVVGCAEHKALAQKAADACVTLVKDTQKNLPIHPETQKRARLVFIQSTPTSKAYKGEPVRDVVVEELERAGFAVTVAPNFHDLEVENGPGMQNMMRMMDCGKMEDFRAAYDVVFLVIYVKGYAQENNVRLRWSCNHSNELPWWTREVPTICVSHRRHQPQLYQSSYRCAAGAHFCKRLRPHAHFDSRRHRKDLRQERLPRHRQRYGVLRQVGYAPVKT